MSKSNTNPSSNPNGNFFPAELRQRLSEGLHLTGKAKRTHDGYIRAVRQLSDFARCSPDQLTETQVRQFFLHLKNNRKFAYGSLRVALSGVKFFFTVTCKRDWEVIRMLKLQNIHALPEVLTGEQVHRLIATTTTQRMLVYFWTVYSMGLRLNEGLNLQVGDIDAQRGLVHIHRGKGAKDRYIPLPTATLRLLRAYRATHYQCGGCGHEHRVAINDSRMVDVHEETVTYRIRRKGNRTETKTVDGEVFVENFLQHVLPTNFMKIRHYGWMSAGSRISI